VGHAHDVHHLLRGFEERELGGAGENHAPGAEQHQPVEHEALGEDVEAQHVRRAAGEERDPAVDEQLGRERRRLTHTHTPSWG
jgi:hypothetical protein